MNQDIENKILNKDKIKVDLCRENKLIDELNERNEAIENTFKYIEHLIEVRIDSIKTEFDSLLRPFKKLKHSNAVAKMFILEKVTQQIEKSVFKPKIICAKNIGNFETQEEIVQKIFEALTVKDYVKTRTLLRKIEFDILVNKEQNDRLGYPKTTPLLHYVIENGHDEIAEYLIGKGANIEIEQLDHPTAIRRNYKETPIFTAAEHSSKILKLLIEKGANINKKNDVSETALIKASEIGHKEAVQLLIDNGAIVNEKDKCRRTALMKSCSSGHKEVAQLLIDNGAIVNEKDNNGYTALMKASLWGHKDVAKLLIYNGALVNDNDDSGRTALSAAYYDTEVAQLLIDNGAIGIKPKKKCTIS